VFTVTDDVLLPTTVTGSWPRPQWFTEGLWGRAFSDAMTHIAYREQFLDAVSAVISDQVQAGLDILTNGDYHLDPSIGGLSWMVWPAERLGGVSRAETLPPPSETLQYPPGSLLSSVVGGWRFPSVTERVSRGRPWELDNIWRTAQVKSDRPVKVGTASAQIFSCYGLAVDGDVYGDDRRQLIWDASVAVNEELRALAAAGCKVIQLEEPLLHAATLFGAPSDYVDFLVDAYHREVEGLDEVELWIHTCWGNPNMQRVIDDNSYATSLEIYMERLRSDVWTLEMKDRGFQDIELFRRYKGKTWPKKVAIGVISHRTLQVESAEEVARDIRRALDFIDPEQLVLSTDCGFGRQGCDRAIAFHKTVSLVQGANIVRQELGGEPRPVPAENVSLQINAPPRLATVEEA
jgi:5-methyltetrahydropteroyltriglutamate--homocysteine methyltransferase